MLKTVKATESKEAYKTVITKRGPRRQDDKV